MSAGMRTVAGARTLARFMLRRDRVRIPLWIVGVVGGVAAQASGLPELYPTAADRQNRAELVDNPAFALFLGGGHGREDYTYGAMIANESAPSVMLAVAIMSITLVARHTRAEEESGRAELIRASAVGRHANTVSTLAIVGGLNLVIGALLGVVLPLTIDDPSWTGAIALGAAVAAVGLVFTGVAVLAAQVTEYSRAATGMALGVLGACLAVKAAGVISDISAFVWVSPLGWSQEIRPFVAERWWPLGLAAVASAGLVAAAVTVSARRDVGGGLMAPGLGPPRASASLGSPVGLAVRLQRVSVVGWAIPLFLFGLMFGGVAEEMADFAEDNEIMQDLVSRYGTASLVDNAIAVFLSFFAVVAAAFTVQSVTVLRREETALRAEPVLATAVSRIRWTASHLSVALVGSVILMAVSGLGYGIARAVSVGDVGELPKLVGAMVSYTPATWTLAAVAVALFGLMPRLSGAPWAAFGIVVLLAWFGPLLDLPTWVYNISPFEHVPAVPAQDLTLTPLLILTGVSAALIGAGLIGIHRRDIAT